MSSLVLQIHCIIYRLKYKGYALFTYILYITIFDTQLVAYKIESTPYIYFADNSKKSFMGNILSDDPPVMLLICSICLRKRSFQIGY